MPKLRTVLWGWRGEPFDDEELAGFDRLCDALDGELGVTLRGLLTSTEVEATRRRVDGLLAARRFPRPSPHWPAVPWPPFYGEIRQRGSTDTTARPASDQLVGSGVELTAGDARPKRRCAVRIR